MPLRRSAAADGVAEKYAMPREAESLPELERIVATLAQRENRWRVYDDVAQRAGLDLDPAELWLLARIGEGTAVDLADPQADRGRRLAPRTRPARERPPRRDGAAVYERILTARRQGLAELLEGWAPEEHDEVLAMLDRFARELVAAPPATS